MDEDQKPAEEDEEEEGDEEEVKEKEVTLVERIIEEEGEGYKEFRGEDELY